MKILIFSWRDIKNPYFGGAEVLTLELARRWVKSGYQVSFLTANFPGGKAQETVDGVNIIRPAQFYNQSPKQYLRYLYQTVRFYRKNLAGRYDIVIDQVHGLPFFTPLYVKEKVVFFPLEVAGLIWFYEVRFPFSLVGYLLEFLYIKLFQKIPFLTISPSTANDLKKLGVQNISTIIPGLSLKPFSKLPHKNPYPLLVSLGRITEMKRIKDTLTVFRLLHKEFPFIKFIVIGRGQEKYLKQLKSLCKLMQIDDRVSFTGFISEEEKRRILSSAWLLVSTSLKEGWGLNVIEAASCGTPTVAYQVPGLIDSIRHGKTGVLCQKNNPISLARNVRKLLLDQKLRQRMAKEALEYSRQFDWDRSANIGLAFLKKSLRS